MVVVKTEKELGAALKADESTIEIEGSLQEKVVKIKATGKVAWAVAIGGIAVAVVAACSTMTTAGTSGPLTVPIGIASIAVPSASLGTTAAISAVLVAVAAGGVGALNKLRKYKMEKSRDGRLVLVR